MCIGCWEDYGSPRTDNVVVRALADFAKAALAVGEDYGDLHIVLEDWNLDDEDIQWCLDNPEDPTPQGLAFAHAALRCTVEERASALGLVDGFWS